VFFLLFLCLCLLLLLDDKREKIPDTKIEGAAKDEEIEDISSGT